MSTTDNNPELPAEVREAIAQGLSYPDPDSLAQDADRLDKAHFANLCAALAPLWPQPNSEPCGGRCGDPRCELTVTGERVVANDTDQTEPSADTDPAKVAEELLQAPLPTMSQFLSRDDCDSARVAVYASILTRFAAELTAKKDEEIERVKLHAIKFAEMLHEKDEEIARLSKPRSLYVSANLYDEALARAENLEKALNTAVSSAEEQMRQKWEAIARAERAEAILELRGELQTKVEQERDQLRAERDQCLAGLEEVNRRYDELKQRNDSLERMMLHLEWTDEQKRILGEIDQLRAEVERLKATGEESDEIIADLRAQIKKLKGDDDAEN